MALEYELGRFALLHWELHGSLGSHALSLSVFYCVSLVPPLVFEPKFVFLLPFKPFPGLPPSVTKTFLFYRESERTVNLPLLLSPLRNPSRSFPIL